MVQLLNCSAEIYAKYFSSVLAVLASQNDEVFDRMVRMSAGINIRVLRAGYKGVEVLKGVNLNIDAAEFVGVVGPNGSGKTTLLRSISRVLAPVSGSIELDKKDIYAIPTREFAQKVAVVPQDTLIAFDFTVLEVTLMGRSPRLGRFSIEGSKDAAIAMEALAQTGTAHLRDRSIAALSGGERQRVMVARALAQEPEIILLDEPTSHLDISFQFEIMGLIKRLNREQGLTVIAVLHDLNLAAQYCDRLVMVGQGNIEADGSPDEVITADNIRRVYGAEVWVRKHPATHRPYVIAGVRPKTSDSGERFDTQPVIHVVGGGGTAAPVMAKLMRRGYRVTCGALSMGDADQEVADALDIPYIPHSIFAPIASDAHKQHLKLIDDADIVTLTDVPIGYGNLLNVEALLYAAQGDKPVVVLKPDLIAERDFSDGQAEKIMQKIVSLGAVSADSVDELVQIIESRYIP